MATQLDTSIPVPEASGARGRPPLIQDPRLVAALFANLIAVQGCGYLFLGTGRAGTCVSEISLVLENLLALMCAWFAFRRAHGIASRFWFLFLVTLLVLLVPSTITLISAATDTNLVSELTWRVLYCLYGTPILMMLFLPASKRDGHLLEIYLDFFLVTIVTSLAFYTFFYLPLQQMVPSDALLRNLDLGNIESVVLSLCVLVRLCTRNQADRDLFLRLGLFVAVCALVTFVGGWFEARGMLALSAWWDLGWALPYAAAGMVAITWLPVTEPVADVQTVNFPALLGKNLVLVGILVTIHNLTDRWNPAHGVILTELVLFVSLLVLTVRLALTQFVQQQEIARRKSAQDELSEAHNRIADLLEEARLEASSLAQVSQFSNLLQACSSREEAFLVASEWLPQLLPGTSGYLSVLNLSRTHVAKVGQWSCAPSASADATSEASGNETGPPPNPLQQPEAVPLIANGEALGMLAICNEIASQANDRGAASGQFSKQTQLAYAIAEHIALTIAGIDLRETLRVQATRDALTGLYNRRHMQESLEREIHRARRRQRTLSIMMLDIDHFKRYNDSFGHPAGDEALRFVAEVLLQNTRAEDLACRYGGEEFLVLLPECSPQQAAVRADEIRNLLKSLYLDRQDELPAMVTVSVGVAAFDGPKDQPEFLLRRADEALYEAKHKGRDRVVIAQPSLAHAATVSK